MITGLIDRTEITDLVTRLGLWLDEQRWGDAPAILTEDATASTLGGTARGREAVVEQARRNHEGKRTQHVITNVVVDLDGDRATARANLLVTFAPEGPPAEPLFQLGERYRFEARRTQDGWRLSAVEIRPLWRTASPDLRDETSTASGRPSGR
jgi:SnoaL-like domain